MSIEQRQHTRYSLDIPALCQSKYGEPFETVLHQLSIGGCLIEWDENIFVGDKLRILAPLPNGNYIPLSGKALYVFEGAGIGVNFLDITRFEQELLAKIISHSLESQNLPIQIDPFAPPRRTFELDSPTMPQIFDERQKREAIIEDILSIPD